MYDFEQVSISTEIHLCYHMKLIPFITRMLSEGIAHFPLST